MEAELQTQIAFYLTGRKPAAEPDSINGTEVRPVVLAQYRDLTALRYDFPLVLLSSAGARDWVQCLSTIVDDVVRSIAKDEDGDRVTKHLLRLEREIRVLLRSGASGALSALWDDAAGRLMTGRDDLLKDSLQRARAALTVDGDVADCNRTMPARLFAHAWAAVQEKKARKVGDDLKRLILKLSDILKADQAHSVAGCSAENLKAAVGGAHADVFDFEAMSRMLSRTAAKDSLPDSRRRRIQALLSVLMSQRFFPVARGRDDATLRAQPYSFMFDNCTSALAAYRERLPKAVELAKSIAIAELEIDGEYREAKHDVFFRDFGDGGLGQEELSHFPDYLVCLVADKMPATENDKLMETLSAGLPFKVLLQTDDLLEESPLAGEGHFAFGMRSKQLANMAMGINDVYVLQSASSNLFQFRDRILKGMAYAGPALFSVFSGVAAKTGALPPYLAAAAAMESRAFPAYTYDPSAGPNWASRFYLEANSQVEADWPVQAYTYEDENHQRVTAEAAFTMIDFVACDKRYAKHFARVPRAKWNNNMLPVGEYLQLDTKGVPDKVPCVLIVDRNNMLHRAIVDDKLIRAAQRCRESWHSLQELGGIHNSHAERLLAREKKSWEEHDRGNAEARAKTEQPAAAPAQPAAATAATPAAEPEETRSPDEAYIETPRCTTCNECTQINNKMFAYNENQQAHIANPDAGTYAQLVEAAESCQVAIIHPGKPRNPNEPGLEDLLQRAAAFT